MANTVLTFIILVFIAASIAAIIAAVVVVLIAVYFYLSKGKKISALELIYKEMKELAKINYDPMLKHLYRLDMPSMGAYMKALDSLTKPNRKLSEMDTARYSELKKILIEYNAQIGRNNRGLYKGEITGINRINLYTSFMDLYQPEYTTSVAGDKTIDRYIMSYENMEGDRIERAISPEEYNMNKMVLDRCGGYLNVIVYETDFGWKIPFIWRNKIERAVLAFDDQISGRDSVDGKLVLLATGFETHGFYFEIPSGFQDRTKVVLSAMTSLTWIRTITLTQNNILEIVNNSLNLNPTLLQGLALKHAEKPVRQVTQKA